MNDKTRKPDELHAPWSGHLEIYPEICCELCNEIIQNHLNCPVCGEKYSGSEQYCELEPENGITVIQCEKCLAKFSTRAHWADPDAIWEQTFVNEATRKRAIWLVMDHLRHGEELMTCIQTRLARRLLIPSSETSALVRDLERDGLVTWRRGSVTLTDLGVDWLEDRA